MNRFLARARKRANLIFLILAFSALSTKAAYAYIDPGTGSYLLQILAASIFAALFAIGAFWKKIRTGVASVLCRKDKG